MGKRLVNGKQFMFRKQTSSLKSWKLKLDKSKLGIRYAVLEVCLIKSENNLPGASTNSVSFKLGPPNRKRILCLRGQWLDKSHTVISTVVCFIHRGWYCGHSDFKLLSIYSKKCENKCHAICVDCITLFYLWTNTNRENRLKKCTWPKWIMQYMCLV